MLQALLTIALACDTPTQCEDDLQRAAQRTAQATLAPDRHPPLEDHLLQAYVRYLQVTDSPHPMMGGAVCRRLGLDPCPPDLRWEWEKATAWPIRPTIPSWTGDWPLAGTFQVGKEIGAITADGRVLRWAVASSAVDERVELPTEICAEPRAVGDEVWVPRQDRRGRCRTLDVFDLATGTPVRTLPMRQDFVGFALRDQESEPWAMVGGKLGVLDPSGRFAWVGGPIPDDVVMADVEAWGRPDDSSRHWLSVDRGARRYVLQQVSGSVLVREDGSTWAHDGSCVLGGGQLICTDPKSKSVWRAPPERPEERTKLRDLPRPTNHRMTSHGGGCLVEPYPWVHVSVTPCANHTGRQGGNHSNEARVNLPVLTHEDFDRARFFVYADVVDPADPAVAAPYVRSIGSLGDLERPATVLVWPDDGERVYLGRATPLAHGVDLEGEWLEMPHVTVQVTAHGEPTGGIRMSWTHPWTQLPSEGVTDPSGALRVPKGVELKVDDGGTQDRILLADRDLGLELTSVPETGPSIEPQAPWPDTTWKAHSARATPVDGARFAEIVPALWEDRAEDRSLLVAFAQPDEAVVFTWLANASRLRTRIDRMGPPSPSSSATGLIEPSPDEAKDGQAGVLGAMREAGFEAKWGVNGKDDKGVGGLIGAQGRAEDTRSSGLRPPASPPSSRAGGLADPASEGDGSSVELGRPRMFGSGADEIARSVEGKKAALDACYAQQLAAGPAPQGDLEFNLHLDGDGAVSKLTVGKGSFRDASLEACLGDVLRGIQFATSEASFRLVTLPVFFRAPK